MAKKARSTKSYNNLSRQFQRIWHKAVESSDVYKEINTMLKERFPDDSDNSVVAFQRADEALRRNDSSLSARDRQLNNRINSADKITTRYLNNLLKKNGFSDATAYFASGDRRDAYNKFKDTQFSYSARAGVTG